MERIEYFSDWRQQDFTCPSCGWSGKGAELESEMFDALFVLECGAAGCYRRIAGSPYPVGDEVTEAAAAGNAEAIEMLATYAQSSAKQSDDS